MSRAAAAVRRIATGLLGTAVVLAGTAAPASAAPAAADAGAGVVRHSATVSAANALIAEVRVTLTRVARVYVEYDNPQAGRYRTALSEPGTEHVIPVVRLRPETTYHYTIFVADDSGQNSEAGRGGGGGHHRAAAAAARRRTGAGDRPELPTLDPGRLPPWQRMGALRP